METAFIKIYELGVHILDLGYLNLPFMWTFYEKELSVLGSGIDQTKADILYQEYTAANILVSE